MKIPRMLLMLALAGAAAGQQSKDDERRWQDAKKDPRRTDGFINCWFWQASNDDVRYGIIIGYLDNWDLVEKAESQKVPIPAVSYREAIAGVTAICSKPENGRLTMYDTLRLFSYRVLRTYDEATLEEITADLRKAHSLLHLP